VEIVLQLSKHITYINLLYEPGYVICVDNITAENSSVSISEFPTGVWILKVMFKMEYSNFLMMTVP
jgi:hypothetical protein